MFLFRIEIEKKRWCILLKEQNIHDMPNIFNHNNVERIKNKKINVSGLWINKSNQYMENRNRNRTNENATAAFELRFLNNENWCKIKRHMKNSNENSTQPTHIQGIAIFLIEKVFFARGKRKIYYVAYFEVTHTHTHLHIYDIYYDCCDGFDH